MKRISNVFGTTLLVKVFPTIFVGSTLLFVGVAVKQVHFWPAIIFLIPLLIFVFSNPARYLNLKEVFLDYEAQSISISMGKARWKEYKFEELEDVISGKMDGILQLYFRNGDAISFLAGKLWGKQAEVEKVKNELNEIIKKCSRK
ncbi:MAG: hypothetical protein HYX40_04895 [Sphingobacteriales bacterium]|nr:hypothetical protein [Sphingobacteriales bacterium]